MTEQGYLLIATEDARYGRQANDCARSIRAADPSRDIVLVADDVAERGIKRDLFSLVINPTELVGELRGTEFHLFMDSLTPFRDTMYVDTDCLVGSASRLSEAWKFLAGKGFGIHGNEISDGKWRVPIAPILKKWGVPHVVQNNGGVVYFDRSHEAASVFKTAQRLFRQKPPEITIRHVHGNGYANEPFWALSLALNGVSPIIPFYDLNVSVKDLIGFSVNRDGVRLFKHGSQHRPVFCHFLGLGTEKGEQSIYNRMLALLP